MGAIDDGWAGSGLRGVMGRARGWVTTGIGWMMGLSTAGEVAQLRVGGVSGDEGLRLRGYRREDALLMESLTVGASAILRGLEARTADLESTPRTSVSMAVVRTCGKARMGGVRSHLSSPAVSASYRRPLPRCRLIECQVRRRSTIVIRRWWRSASIGIGWAR